MSENIIRAAVDLVDAEPTDKFVSTLGGQLLAELDADQLPQAEPAPPLTEHEATSAVEFVALAGDPSRLSRMTRPQRIFLAVAACLTVFAAAALIATRRDDSSEPGSELTDVDPREAQPLADAAGISADVLGAGWQESEDQGGVPFSQLDAETTAALPQCAALRAFGVWSPTTKSVTAHQFLLLPGDVFIYHEVMVFASSEDASKAMDMIESDLFRECTFDRFDRLAPFWPRVGTTSRSELWDGVPEISPHGDRQVAIGQHLVYQFSGAPGPEFMLVNVYVQVGRAIAWVDPLYLLNGEDPLVKVDAVLEATTAALEKVFGD